MLAPGDADEHEEVLVDGDHADRAVVAGDLAERVAEGVDGVVGGRGDLLHLPRPVVAERSQREVDLAGLLGHAHTSLVLGPPMSQKGGGPPTLSGVSIGERPPH